MINADAVVANLQYATLMRRFAHRPLAERPMVLWPHNRYKLPKLTPAEERAFRCILRGSNV